MLLTNRNNYLINKAVILGNASEQKERKMKKVFAFMVLVLIVFGIAATSEAVTKKESYPQVVGKYLADYERDPSYKERYAFARPFGWGTGNYKGAQFHWFAATNTDGLFFVKIGTVISQPDIKKLGEIKDSLKRSYEVHILDGASMLVFTSNDWIFEKNEPKFAKKVKGEVLYDGRKVVDYYIDNLNRAVPELNLRFGGMLW